ncbi:hypothetical protein V8G54_028611 [Vigna mungo]|uniref:WRC domain-containing protein n=1 Tax=Vigna mungo TaxID=3915 RepID=A0AAQ3RLU6_VIGMU
MDHARSTNGEDNAAGIPDDLRCKRSDGKQWRCTAMSMPDKTVCEKHYIQAKKRAANSAMRANLKKAKRKSQSLNESDFRYTPERDARRASSARHAHDEMDVDVDADADADADVDVDVDVDADADADVALYEEDNWVSYDSPPDSSLKRSRRSLDANATTLRAISVGYLLLIIIDGVQIAHMICALIAVEIFEKQLQITIKNLRQS